MFLLLVWNRIKNSFVSVDSVSMCVRDEQHAQVLNLLLTRNSAINCRFHCSCKLPFWWFFRIHWYAPPLSHGGNSMTFGLIAIDQKRLLPKHPLNHKVGRARLLILRQLWNSYFRESGGTFENWAWVHLWCMRVAPINPRLSTGHPLWVVSIEKCAFIPSLPPQIFSVGREME